MGKQDMRKQGGAGWGRGTMGKEGRGDGEGGQGAMGKGQGSKWGGLK